MRVLVAAQDFPWPSNYGSRIRLANVVKALAELGEIDLFTFTWRATDVSEPPSDCPVERWKVLPRPVAERTFLRNLRWLLGGRLPSDFLGRDYEPVQTAFAGWAHPRYDLIWFSRLEPYVTLGHLVEGPAIIDVDDLADWKAKAHVRSRRADGWAQADSRSSARNGAKRVKERKDINAWRRLQLHTARSVAAMVVCSDVDRRRLGVSNAVVVPNGYELPARSVGGRGTPHPPTVLFQGTFGYEPNVDAARFLVHQIGPALRSRVANAQIRLVGKAGRTVLELADLPRVIVTGSVPEMEPELAVSDVVAVPLRYGSGTRIKILEAFAHKLPVVTTALGAEGLEVVQGRHLLIADTPEEFATACWQILNDPGLRRSLVEAAHALFLRKYQWERIRAGITSLGSQTIGRTNASEGVRIEP